MRQPADMSPPVAQKDTLVSEIHGIKRSDDYAWLRAENWQDAMREPALLPKDIADYLTAENAYCASAMAETASLQEELIAEMRGRIQEDDQSVPTAHGPYLYGTTTVQGGEHYKVTRTPRDGGTAQVILDIDAEAQKHAYFVAGGTRICPNHRFLAWSADTSGAEFYTLRFRDTQTDADVGAEIADVGSFVWADADTVFYTRVDPSHRPNKVFRHRFGTDTSEDVLVYEEKDTRYFTGVGATLDRAFITINTGMNDENEVWVLPTSDPSTAPRVVQPRTPGLEYNVAHRDGTFYIITNADAEDFRIVTAPVDQPTLANWTDVVPHHPGQIIVDASIYADWLVWLVRENALPVIKYMALGGDAQAVKTIAFDEAAFSLGIVQGKEFETATLRLHYASPTTPAQVWDYDLATGTRVLMKETVIPSGHDPAQYKAERIFARSHDGAEVPVTVLYHKDTPLDGTAPCYLYGYGSYGHALPASFQSKWLSLADRGFVCVVAHVRGGEEKGRAWYEAAKFAGKINTFKDFIATAEHLVAQNYTAAGRIVISGGSAGGLLVGAATNMVPDLWGGVIADVPFVDVLNTILDDTLPLTPGEWSQWGNPIESAEAYADIAAYSPYDNVTARAYPPMLVTAGVSDPRVTYWEPAKWVAKLRATKTDTHVLMLKTNMTSGHFGASGRFARLEDDALSYAFALRCVGL